MKSRAEELSDAVRAGLLRLVRSRVERKAGGHLIEDRLEALDLRLPLPLTDGDEAARRFSDRLIAAIDEQIDDALQQAAAFRPGHAWCHRCASVDCEHSRPMSSRHVFAGYNPTGLPCWEDFAQVCLERRHPRVDQLYDDRPVLLALVQNRAALSGRMLQAFENRSYELLGQVVAGFFPIHAPAEEGRGVVAITVQVAGSFTRRGRVRLGLNLLGLTPAGEDLERLWDRHEELPWRRAVRWAQTALTGVTADHARRGVRRSREVLERRVERILDGLARRLERGERARSRRTRHAEQRHASGERPTRKALDDARAVADGTLFVDERSGTMVVLGERGRTHFFTPGGRLVSSVRYSREAIERKLKFELWRPATGTLLDEFRSKLPS